MDKNQAKDIKHNTQLLALAIIQQAVKDYRRSVGIINLQPNNREHRCKRTHLEKFFKSSWFEMLCPVDPMAVLEKLQEMSSTRETRSV